MTKEISEKTQCVLQEKHVDSKANIFEILRNIGDFGLQDMHEHMLISNRAIEEKIPLQSESILVAGSIQHRRHSVLNSISTHACIRCRCRYNR